VVQTAFLAAVDATIKPGAADQKGQPEPRIALAQGQAGRDRRAVGTLGLAKR